MLLLQYLFQLLRKTLTPPDYLFQKIVKRKPLFSKRSHSSSKILTLPTYWIVINWKTLLIFSSQKLIRHG